MKIIKIPMFQVALRIYKNDERERFEKIYGKILDEWYGYQIGEAVFIAENPKQNMVGTCYHEATHWVDWMIEERLGVDLKGPLWSHTELRAYMVQYIGNEIMEYCCE